MGCQNKVQHILKVNLLSSSVKLTIEDIQSNISRHVKEAGKYN